MTENENLGFEFEPLSGSADSLCVMIHGYGADGSDMIAVAAEMSVFLPNTHFMAPNGPEPCPTAPGYYQWYSFGSGREGADQGAATVAPLINRYADIQLERLGLEDSRLIMFGFSQGGGIIIEAALRRARTCAALLCFTSAIRNRDKLADEITARPPTMLIHGELDDVVPIRHVINTAEILEEHGISVRYHICPGIGHTLNEEGAYMGAMFIAEMLGE
jgi:phospholipase/carboxylesterase|tara:strand:- start:3418 stop:4071 length:654 start_codon:yes stop_codon:yes gene_type:complete